MHVCVLVLEHLLVAFHTFSSLRCVLKTVRCKNGRDPALLPREELCFYFLCVGLEEGVVEMVLWGKVRCHDNLQANSSRV